MANAESYFLKALSIPERIKALRNNKNSKKFYNRKIGNLKIKSWKSLKGFKENPENFYKKLEILGCTENEFKYVLGTPVDKLFSKHYKPIWFKKILEVEKNNYKPLFESKIIKTLKERGLVSPFIPLIISYSNLLFTELKNIHNLSEVFSSSEKQIDLLLKPFLQNFEQNVRRSSVLEINSLRLLGHLQGKTSNERYKSFTYKCNDSNFRLNFFSKYPILAKYAVNDLELWLSSSIEFLNFLSKDWKRIQSKFNIKSSDKILSIIPSGDTHNNGRSVVILTFYSGKKIIYKPRNLAIDVCFQNYLNWFNSNNPKLKLKTFEILSSKNHGWVEFVEKKKTTKKKQN